MFGQRDDVLNALKEASAGSLPETSSPEARQLTSAGKARRPRRRAGGSDHNGKLVVGVS
jgi:hypothetical protein